ncbi:alanine racemase [Nitrospirillum amazonense]|uniref:alanine racemase n=1 Tax=Nitrospirillum amazonense TaxID=28077 RepID=UPI002DD44832|nr:alanine racemase [Nitrospirillum amazonense]MEC4591893.1 alanine racemase [Nitrospirillum amazonense]
MDFPSQVPAGAGAVLAIDLDAIAGNWRVLRDHAQRSGRAVECAGVVKADGYGLGAVPVATALAGAGCRSFFVADLEEATTLRAALPDARVLVLHGPAAGTEREMAALGLTPVLNSLDDIARWRATAVALDRPLAAYIHIDTGMNRLGLDDRDARHLAEEPDLLAGLALSGWMSHLASADVAGDGFAAEQDARFRAHLARLPRAPASLAASSGIFREPALLHDLVRPGAALYGVNPTPEASNPMAPALRLLGRILQVRDVPAGATVGYGATHRTTAPTRLATIAVGYADGYFRALGSSGHVTIAGVRAPVVGRISMDLLSVDATRVPPEALVPGAFAELIGPDRPLDDVAADAGTIGYEILTGLGRRFCRVYQGAWPVAAQPRRDTGSLAL